MITCEPAVSEEMVRAAWAAPSRLAVPRVAVPSVVAPSLKVTLPEGTPVPGATGATVAVTVTGWPTTGVLAGAASVVVVVAWFTV